MPCHKKIRGVTTKADIAPANIVTTRVINTRRTQAVINLTPISMFQGSMTTPIPIRPNRINKKASTNLNSLTTRKQINKDARIISRYVITNVFASA
jgi:hypothetical protein